MEQTNKTHREKDKKTSRKKKLHTNGFNAKAFTVSAPGRLQKEARRTQDLNEKKFHVPMVNRTIEEEAPPIIVTVFGPPGTGKSTLIRSLVRRYTKHTISDIKGPVTVISGKRQRLTFIECSNDLNTMIDIAKISDLVLLLIDGNYGFEMETMEFLNILSIHGFPRILGITTHLDLFKSSSSLKNSKKLLKKRFWTEVYQGAKLFYLSGVINGRYPDREILNLSRFISVMKFRPLKWRNEHPYLLADRIIDITHPEKIEKNPLLDRNVSIYGYLHGSPLKYLNQRIHIPGVGDFTVSNVERLPDPCPTPYFDKKLIELGKKPKRKRLDDKQKLIYAPMSDVGGVLVDKDAVYVDVGSTSFNPDQPHGLGEKMVIDLQSTSKALGETNDGIQLFSSSDMIYKSDNPDDLSGRKSLRSANIITKDDNQKDLENDDDNDDEDDNDDDDENIIDEDNYDNADLEYNNIKNKHFKENKSNTDENYAYADSDSDLGSISDNQEYENYNDDERAALKWKQNLSEKAAAMYNSKNNNLSLQKLIYMDEIPPDQVMDRWLNGLNSKKEDLNGKEEDIKALYEQDEEEKKNQNNQNYNEEDNDFFKKKEDESNKEPDEDGIYRPSYAPQYPEDLSEWENPEVVALLSDRFLTKALPDVGDEELYDDFEDLEANENENENENTDDNVSENDESGKENENENENEETSMSLAEERKNNAKKKEALRLKFEEEEEKDDEWVDGDGNKYDTWHDVAKAKIAKKLEINKAIYEKLDPDSRDRIEGFRSGTYVRLVIKDMPCEFIKHFDPSYPVILGGLLSSEDRVGFMKARIKRHRWHKKILKTKDPLILSLGWRRFQTIPIYTTSDSRTRNRMLKYTPEHMHCFVSFYGPLVNPNTAFCAFQSVSSRSLEKANNFRVAATGVILEVDEEIEIVKKLKLVGVPYQIYKNTAFIKNMFNSALEVAKFEGASIRTVSGIRGQIKRALSSPEGCFRATFEDKILMSDIVFLRAWYTIKPNRWFNLVTSLLLEDKESWEGMRLVGEIRKDEGIDTPLNKDSAYHKIERQTRHFNPLYVPKSIKSNLPFKSQISTMKKRARKSDPEKKAIVLDADSEEKKARELMLKVLTIRKDKETKRKAKQAEKRVEYMKKVTKEENIRAEKARERKKEFFSSRPRSQDHEEVTKKRRTH